jgi:membrane associated rhomboid family serine protease
MRDFLREVDTIPATIVVAIAYVTLAVVTGMMGPPEEFVAKTTTYGTLWPAAVAAGEPWRLLAYAFLHGNPVHLLMNFASLWSLGPALERSLGSVRFAVLYVVASVGGGLAVCLVNHPEQRVVGGSGALFGMLGAAVAMNMRGGRHLFAFLDFEGPRRLLATIAVWLVLGALLPFISNTGHVGGLVAGFLVTFLWLRPGAPSAARTHWRLATTALFAGMLFWSLVPATRVDWLWTQGTNCATADPARSAQLLRAAELADPRTYAWLRQEARKRRPR